MEREIEVMMNKARWEDRSKKERKGEGEKWSEDLQDEIMKEYTVYDDKNNMLNFEKQKVTEMPTCRRITLPECEDERFEIQLRMLKSDMMKEVGSYRSKKCDEKGNIKMTNLNKEQKKGLKECRKLNKEGETSVLYD